MAFHYRQQPGLSHTPSQNLAAGSFGIGANAWPYDLPSHSANPHLQRHGLPDGRLLAPDLYPDYAPPDHHASDRSLNFPPMPTDPVGLAPPGFHGGLHRNMDDYFNGGGRSLYQHQHQDPPPAHSLLQRPQDGLSSTIPYFPEGPAVHNGRNPGLAQSQYAFQTPTPPRQRAGTPSKPAAPLAKWVEWEQCLEGTRWQPWDPGIAFYALPGERIDFRIGTNSYYAVFDSNVSGIQVNKITGQTIVLRKRAPTDVGKEHPPFAFNGQEPRTEPRTRSPSPKLPEQVSQGATFVMGEKVHIYSLGQRDWLLGEVLEVSENGMLKVQHQFGQKHVLPETIPTTIRKIPKEAPLHTQTAPSHEQASFKSKSPAGPHMQSAPNHEQNRTPAAQNEFMHEAYREMQKLQQRPPSQPQRKNEPELPEVIELGEGPMMRAEPSAVPSVPAPPVEIIESQSEPDAFAVLDALQVQLQAVESRLGAIIEALEEEVTTPGQARDNLAQLEARLYKLQSNGIDAISTAGLAPENVDSARARRKELTNQAEKLQSRMDGMFARIKNMT